jgi:hypothetical protein
VEARALDIRNGSAPADAMKAYRMLNKKLAEDNTSGTYVVQDSGQILDFPGVSAPKPVSIAPVELVSSLHLTSRLIIGPYLFLWSGSLQIF